MEAGNERMKVGILAVQGDFEAHGATLARIGVEHVFLRTPSDMDGLDAVILPGGESTTQWKFLVEEGLDKSLLEYASRGGAIFGTCAGAILLAREVRNEMTSLSPAPSEMVFIRAPIIERTGTGVDVLARSDEKPVLMRQGRILIATFHPELTSDITVHEYFLRMARLETVTSSKNDPRSDVTRSGKALWSAERPDEHARRLRES